MTMIRSFLPLLFTLFIGQFATAQVYSTEEGHAEVYGENSMTSYTGISDQLEGWIDLQSRELAFELELETLKTGNSLRDGHMYDALETDSFPKARFKGRLLSDLPEKGELGFVTVKGEFTIHGRSKRMEIQGAMKRIDGQIQVAANFSILITEFGMERPGYSFVTVQDEHEIEVKAKLKPEAG